MFNEINKRDLLERIEGQKRGLRRLSKSIMETALGPSTIEGRNEALFLHALAHQFYCQLERMESRVSQFNDMVDEILEEILTAHFLFNGKLALLQMRTTEED